MAEKSKTAPMPYDEYRMAKRVMEVEEENERLREALGRIADLIAYLQREADNHGLYLNGAMATAMANDANWIKGIAKQALEGSGEGMKVTKTTAYICNAELKYPKGAICGKAYLGKERAENCCKPKFCECGAEIKYSGWTVCEPCKEKKQYERAEKLTEWDGWVSWEGYGSNDGYFSSVNDLLEYCEDEEISPPKWVFVCKEQEHKIDIDRVIDIMIDDAYEGAGDHLVDVKELEEFIDGWNDKQNITTYYPDYKRVLILEGWEKE